MSTEPVRRTRRAAADAARFRRGLLATIGILAAASVALGFAAVFQGPRLEDATVDTQGITRLAGSRVILELNQPIARVGDLDVHPTEPADLAVDGARLVITFERPLPAASEVTIAVDDVVGTSQTGASTIEYRFTTPDLPVYTLIRRSPAGKSDVVRRTTIGGETARDVLESPRLQSFAHAGDVVAAVAVEEDDTNTLRIAGIGEDVQALGMPEPGIVSDIGGSTTHPLIAYVFTGATRPDGGEPVFRDTLFVLDVSGQNAAPAPVLGLDGSPMSVSEWRFVPGTTSLVVHDSDGAIWIVDALGFAPPTPLGTHAELRGVLPGTTDLVVADPDRGTLLDLTTGEARANDLPRAELPDGAYAGRVQQLDADGTYLMDVLLVSNDPAGGKARSAIIRVDSTGTAMRFDTGPESRLLSSCVSPNGRYLAVETGRRGGDSDGYPHAPSSIDRLTTIVDIASGDTLLSQNGGSSNWCR